MTPEVERKVLLVQEDRGVIALLPCLCQLLDRSVGTLHVGGMVFAVV
jgi:hypothetical protein